jgi:hypothetical protein
MNGRTWIGAVGMAFALALGACGGSSSSSGNDNGTLSVGSLQGTWYGTVGSIKEPSSALGTITVDFDSNGGMTVTAPGRMSTGTASHTQGNLFGYVMIDGTKGGFMVDDSVNHAAFLGDNASFGVVQKGASELPTYTMADIVGAWSGSTVELSGLDLELVRTYSSSVTVASDYSITGSGGHGSFSGSLSETDPTYGRYSGTVTQEEGGSTSDIAVFLSADKSSGAGYGCMSGDFTFPDDCGFTLWHR